MAKKVVFVPGDKPGHPKRLHSAEMVPIHEVGIRLARHCEGRRVFVLRTDTLAPKKTVATLRTYLNIVEVFESRVLNFSHDYVNKADEDGLLNLLNLYEGREEVLLICAPTELINSFIRLWCGWNFVEPCDLRTTTLGTAYVADVEAKTFELI